MEKHVIFFEEDPLNPGYPKQSWMVDYKQCVSSHKFDTMLVDLQNLIDGNSNLPKASHKNTPTMLRVDPLDEERYRAIYHKLKRLGYRLVDTFIITSCDMNRLKSDSQDRIRVNNDISSSVEGIIPYGSGLIAPVGQAGDSNAEQPTLSQAADASCATFGWRVFYYGRIPFAKFPIATSDQALPISYPKLSLKDMEKAHPYGCFSQVDFQLSKDNIWECVYTSNGQFSHISDTTDDFYVNLADAIEKAPLELPSYIWCLTGKVVDINHVGEERRLVHGTRYFAPGTLLQVQNFILAVHIGIHGVIV